MQSLGEVAQSLLAGLNPNPPHPLPEAWAFFLGLYPWQWYGTFTFRDRVHPEYADKQFRLWVSKLNAQIGGKKWYRSPDRAIYWVRGLEFQKRGVIHFHAVFYHKENLNVRLGRFDAKVEWAKQLAGTQHDPRPDELKGNCRLERPRMQADVNDYVAKYCTKDGEIDVSANLPCRTDPRPICQEGLLR